MAEQTKKLYRSEKDKIVAGVASGLAEYLDLDATLIRIAFAMLIFFAGSGVLVYLMMWIIIPTRSDSNTKSSTVVKKNTEEIKEKVQEVFGKEGKVRAANENPFGYILIAVGIFFLMSNFGLLSWFDFDMFWPVLLILIGIFALNRKS